MKNYTFYQLLDRELPRTIDGARDRLTAVDKNHVSGTGPGNSLVLSCSVSDGNQKRNPSLDKVYPMGKGRGTFSCSGSRIQDLMTMRDALCQLSVAYAISSYDPFAMVAGRLVGEELLASGVLSVEEWTEAFSLSKTSEEDRYAHRMMVEIVLGLEMLRALKKIENKHLRRLEGQLRKRLQNLNRKRVGQIDLADEIVCLLEQVLLALFLKDNECLEKLGHLVASSYSEYFTEYLSEGDHAGKTEFFQCVDDYFALCFWLDQGLKSSTKYIDLAFRQLRERFSDSEMELFPNGAWVSAGERTFVEALLRDTSIFLFLGEGLDRPELFDCWLEAMERSTSTLSSHSTLLTSPLLWFSSEEWDYRPFKSHRSSFIAGSSRL